MANARGWCWLRFLRRDEKRGVRNDKALAIFDVFMFLSFLRNGLGAINSVPILITASVKSES